MTNPISPEINQMEEPLALPRANGELQFAAPWEARAFGLAVALNTAGVFPWSDFSAQLAAEINQTEAAGQEAPYYESWLKALEALMIRHRVISANELEKQAEQQAHHDSHDHHH